MEKITIDTKLGKITGFVKDDVTSFFGLPYAKAERFCYAKKVESFDQTREYTKFSYSCPQTRAYVDQTSDSERKFYFREFREGESYEYDEDCLNLNVWAPKDRKDCPTVIWIHGGGFNSGSNDEKYIDGKHFAKRGIIFIAINYRVGVLGYACGEKIKSNSMEGNFGLSDQLTAIEFIRENITSFGGDPQKITLMGQSAGAISIQYLISSGKVDNLVSSAIMLSGGGFMPKFALPKDPKDTREYWQSFAKSCGKNDISDLKDTPLSDIFVNFENFKKTRKDNQFNCMPVIDGKIIDKTMNELKKNGLGLHIPTLIGSTKHDMLPYILYKMAKNYAKSTISNSYVYFFDRDLPGCDNKSFHSCDLWYTIGNMENCWRPFTKEDYKLKDLMMDYLENFIKRGNPNGKDLPLWLPTRKGQQKCMYFDLFGGKMKKPKELELLNITIKNEKYHA